MMMIVNLYTAPNPHKTHAQGVHRGSHFDESSQIKKQNWKTNTTQKKNKMVTPYKSFQRALTVT